MRREASYSLSVVLPVDTGMQFRIAKLSVGPQKNAENQTDLDGSWPVDSLESELTRLAPMSGSLKVHFPVSHCAEQTDTRAYGCRQHGGQDHTSQNFVVIQLQFWRVLQPQSVASESHYCTRSPRLQRRKDGILD